MSSIYLIRSRSTLRINNVTNRYRLILIFNRTLCISSNSLRLSQNALRNIKTTRLHRGLLATINNNSNRAADLGLLHNLLWRIRTISSRMRLYRLILTNMRINGSIYRMRYWYYLTTALYIPCRTQNSTLNRLPLCHRDNRRLLMTRGVLLVSKRWLTVSLPLLHSMNSTVTRRRRWSY